MPGELRIAVGQHSDKGRKQTNQDFHGVLISDFFASYDGLDCAKQKCLVHLIRDLNDDLIASGLDVTARTLMAASRELLAQP